MPGLVAQAAGLVATVGLTWKITKIAQAALASAQSGAAPQVTARTTARKATSPMRHPSGDVDAVLARQSVHQQSGQTPPPAPFPARRRNASPKMPRWAASDEVELTRLVGLHGLGERSWAQISEDLQFATDKERTAQAVSQHWRLMLKKRAPGPKAL